MSTLLGEIGCNWVIDANPDWTDAQGQPIPFVQVGDLSALSTDDGDTSYVQIGGNHQSPNADDPILRRYKDSVQCRFPAVGNQYFDPDSPPSNLFFELKLVYKNLGEPTLFGMGAGMGNGVHGIFGGTGGTMSLTSTDPNQYVTITQEFAQKYGIGQAGINTLPQDVAVGLGSTGPFWYGTDELGAQARVLDGFAAKIDGRQPVSTVRITYLGLRILLRDENPDDPVDPVEFIPVYIDAAIDGDLLDTGVTFN